jgi:hypothetical protein
VLLLTFGLGAAALLSAALDRFLPHPLDVPHPETLVRAIERHPPSSTRYGSPLASMKRCAPCAPWAIWP